MVEVARCGTLADQFPVLEDKDYVVSLHHAECPVLPDFPVGVELGIIRATDCLLHLLPCHARAHPGGILSHFMGRVICAPREGQNQEERKELHRPKVDRFPNLGQRENFVLGIAGTLHMGGSVKIMGQGGLPRICSRQWSDIRYIDRRLVSLGNL